MKSLTVLVVLLPVSAFAWCDTARILPRGGVPITPLAVVFLLVLLACSIWLIVLKRAAGSWGWGSLLPVVLWVALLVTMLRHTPPPPAPPVGRYQVVRASPLRRAPHHDTEAVAELQKGMRVYVVSRRKDNWLKVKATRWGRPPGYLWAADATLLECE